MPDPTPDLSVATELLARLDVGHWAQWTEGLFQPRPWIRIADSERLEDTTTWLAARVLEPRSALEAASQNALRVAKDLQMVLHHDMDAHSERYWISEWYRTYYGQPEFTQALADYKAHAALIHNLGAELTRAINLIVERGAAANAKCFADSPLATISAGSEDFATPVSYSPTERGRPQPYPGLRAFPTTLPARADGSFGVGHRSDAPTPPELVQWVSTIEARWGPGTTGPPDTPEDLPASIPSDLGTSSLLRTEEEPVHSRVRAAGANAFAALAVAGALIQVATAPALLLGAATGAAMGAAIAFRTQWTWPPPLLPTALIAILVIAGALVATYITRPDNTGQAERPQQPQPTKTSPAAVTPPLDPDASCASVQQTAGDNQQPRMMFTSSPGQLAGGDSMLEGKASGDKNYSQVVQVTPGDDVQLSTLLHNTQYGTVTGVVVRAKLRHDTTSCWRVTTSSRSRSHGGAEGEFGPAFLVAKPRQAVDVKYVRRSARLFDEGGNLLARLPDSILTTGAQLPYGVPGGASYFVNFSVRVQGARRADP